MPLLDNIDDYLQPWNKNPRLQVDSVDQYVEIMNNLKLANPKMMDVAVPANLKGVTLESNAFLKYLKNLLYVC